MKLLTWVILAALFFAVAADRAPATELVIKQTISCEVPDVDPTLVKVFQTDKKVKTNVECQKLTRTFSATISDRYLGVDHLVMPQGKAMAFVPKPGVEIAGVDKTWCGLTQVMNRGATARISVRILPAGSSCENPPEGSVFLREFRLERNSNGHMMLTEVCLLPSKRDICISSEQLTAEGRKNADWILDMLRMHFRSNQPSRLSQFF